MATETTKTHASLVCGIQEIGALDIVDIHLPRRPYNPPAGTKVATRIRSGKFRVSAQESSLIMGPAQFAVGLGKK